MNNVKNQGKVRPNFIFLRKSINTLTNIKTKSDTTSSDSQFFNYKKKNI